MRVFVFLALLGVALAGMRGPRVVGGVPSSIEEFPFIVNMQYYWFGLWWRHDCSGSLLTSRTVLSAAYCYLYASERHNFRIVGGSPTTIESFPFMSNMELRWQGVIWTQFCGGSLITTRTVLSGAHCFFGWTSSFWRVRLGSAFTSSGSIHELTHNGIHLHEGYNDKTLDNDIAVIHLANPAILSSTVGRARIAGTNYDLSDGTTVTAIGWGSLWAGGPYSEQLQSVDVNLINQRVCALRYAYLKTQPGSSHWPDVTPRMLCAGILNIGGKDACQRDSGGPLVHANDVVVGITSWGYSCAHEFYPGVYARVSSFSDWIVDNGSL